MHRRGIDDQIDVRRDIFRFLGLSVMDAGAPAFQKVCKGRAVPVGAGYPEAFLKKDFGKAGHADAADADKVNVDGMVKIYMIHENALPVCYFRQQGRRGTRFCRRIKKLLFHYTQLTQKNQ